MFDRATTAKKGKAQTMRKKRIEKEEAAVVGAAAKGTKTVVTPTNLIRMFGEQRDKNALIMMSAKTDSPNKGPKTRMAMDKNRIRSSDGDKEDQELSEKKDSRNDENGNIIKVPKSRNGNVAKEGTKRKRVDPPDKTKESEILVSSGGRAAKRAALMKISNSGN